MIHQFFTFFFHNLYYLTVFKKSITSDFLYRTLPRIRTTGKSLCCFFNLCRVEFEIWRKSQTSLSVINLSSLEDVFSDNDKSASNFSETASEMNVANSVMVFEK